MDDATIQRQQTILDAYGLYGDTSAWPGLAGGWSPQRGRLSHNIIANAVDTLVSEITQTQPRPMAVTVGGDWDQRQRAEKLTQYWDASFDILGIREIAPQVARDAVISGLGIWRSYVDWEYSCVRVERIFPLLLLVDDVSCVDAEPRSIYLRHFIDKWQLIERVKSDESLSEERKEELCHAIWKAEAPDARYSLFADARSDVIELIEAWHLPSVPCDGAHATEYDQDSGPQEGGHEMPTDGRHCIVFNGDTIFDCPYYRDRFPLSVMRPVPAQRGFWGESLVMRAAPAQTELNKLLQRIQDAMHLVSVPRVLVPNGSINEAQLVNDVGVVIKYSGSPPQMWTPQAMGGDVYEMVRQYAAWIFEEIGVSQMSATSVKPKGLYSGAAIDTYNDVQSKRFIGFERSYETAHISLARELVVSERDLATYSSGHEVAYSDGEDRDYIDFSEVDMDDRDYRVRILPASALATTASRQIETIQEMVKEGLLPPEIGFAAMFNPDPKALIDRIIAPIRLLERIFTLMLRTGDYRAPEPYQDLTKGIDLAKLTIQEAELKGAPDDRIELLRQWVADAADLLKRTADELAAEERANAPPPPPEPPMGPPGAMPPMLPPGMPMDPSMGPPMAPPPMDMSLGPMPMPPGVLPGEPISMPPEAAMMPPIAAA